MAKVPSHPSRIWLDQYALSGYLTASELKVEQETFKVDGFSNAGPERVVGNYDWSESLAGHADFASGQGDATLFGLVGSAGVAAGFDPTGTTAGANDPNYDGTVVLKSYGIKASVGAPITYSAELEGASALTRATS